jgi:membrane protein implicated in regulation of membrane protease activity
MSTLFLACAVVGGTLLVCQTLMTLLGLGAESLHLEVPHDVGHDIGPEVPHDLGGDAHVETAGGHDGEHAAEHHGSLGLLRMLSFRSLVAAVTFFGLAGMAARAADAAPPLQLAVAGAAGFAALYAVWWLMQSLYGLRSEGTVRVERAVGRRGTAYLTIPGNRQGSGKIQINLQNRTMEYLAVTAGPDIPTGAAVVVVDLINPTTLEVATVSENERDQDG